MSMENLTPPAGSSGSSNEPIKYFISVEFVQKAILENFGRQLTEPELSDLRDAINRPGWIGDELLNETKFVITKILINLFDAVRKDMPMLRQRYSVAAKGAEDYWEPANLERGVAIYDGDPGINYILED